MKRIGLLLGLGVAGLLAGQAVPVLAESKETPFTVTLTPGNIELTSVPATFSFGELLASDLAAKGGALTTSNSPGAIQVADYRGSTGGWSLQMTYDPFNPGDSIALIAPKLTLDVTEVNQKDLVKSDTAVTGNEIVDESPTVSDNLTNVAPNVPTEVASTTDARLGRGLNQYNLNAATLSLPPQNQFEATDYTSKITWTLTPGTTPAAGEDGTN